jgi:succinate dehydrogenase / fumarate reductase cytochrome b subunit
MRADKRPIYLNLLKIHLPVTGMVSLAHRASGVLLFVAIPLAAWLLEDSVSSREGFDAVMQILQQPLLQLLALALVWALAHHFFAGLRFLLIDADIGVEKTAARRGAWLVIALELLTVVGVAYGVWR